MSDEGLTDYRFILANERTCLAYTRTALSFQAAGLAVLQFLTEADDVIRLILGFAFVTTGSVIGGAGFVRWRANERAIRAGDPIPTARALSPIMAAVVVIPLLGAALLAMV